MEVSSTQVRDILFSHDENTVRTIPNYLSWDVIKYIKEKHLYE